jgi:hypothetical protein
MANVALSPLEALAHPAMRSRCSVLTVWSAGAGVRVFDRDLVCSETTPVDFRAVRWPEPRPTAHNDAGARLVRILGAA